MTTYSQLQTDVAAWLADETLGSKIPGFVRLCEADIRREIRVRAMVTQDSAFAISGASASLPSDWVELVSVSRITDTGNATLEFYPIEQFYDHRLQSYGAGYPKIYTIINDSIHVAPSASAGTTLRISYWKAFDALSDTNTTNWLLTNAYDVYLFGTLYHAAIYLQSIDAGTGDLMAVAGNNYETAKQRVMREESRARGSGAARRRTGGAVA